MHNKVVYRMARALRRAGAVVLRFNYRGVNLSQGEYDNGVGEVEDARAALALLRSRYPDLPFSLAGFSFGSRIILKLGCETPGVSRLIAVGFPANLPDSQSLGQCSVPRGLHREHGTINSAPFPPWKRTSPALPEPKELIWVDAADHFFGGALDQFEETVYRTEIRLSWLAGSVRAFRAALCGRPAR